MRAPADRRRREPDELAGGAELRDGSWRRARPCPDQASEDEHVTNRRRAEIANAARADIMIRLHCDAASGRGFAIYYPTAKERALTGPSVDDRGLARPRHPS